MMRVERYIVKISSFGTVFYDTMEQRELTLDEVKDLLNNPANLGPDVLRVSQTMLPIESFESDGMPIVPILEVK